MLWLDGEILTLCEDPLLVTVTRHVGEEYDADLIAVYEEVLELDFVAGLDGDALALLGELGDEGGVVHDLLISLIVTLSASPILWSTSRPTEYLPASMLQMLARVSLARSASCCWVRF